MRILVTGAAGFIGSNLVDVFLDEGHSVIGMDNLSRGSLAHLARAAKHNSFQFIEVDIADDKPFFDAFSAAHTKGAIDEVWHMAANSDIPAGVLDARVDLRNTFMTTFNVLEGMKKLDVKTIAFASSSAIYGDLLDTTLTETIGPLLPISNYGAMKLASEAAITAAAESHLASAYIFRFPNVIGVPATHGVVFDFIKRLRQNPKNLTVLGDGTQQKIYLHVEDLLSAMCFVRRNAHEKVNYYNIGVDDGGISVRFIAEETVRRVAPAAEIIYGQEGRGWVGDVPRFRYSIDKLRALGWAPSASSEQSMVRAIEQIAAQGTL